MASAGQPAAAHPPQAEGRQGEVDPTQRHHDPETPERDAHDRCVVTGAVLGDRGGLQVVDPLHLRGEGVRGHERQHVGDLDVDLVLAVGDVPVGEQGPARALLGVPQRLGGGHLHRLLPGHDLALEVPGEQHPHRRHGTHHQAQPHGPAVQVDLLPPAQVPTGQPDQHRARGEQRGGQHVREGDDLRRVRQRLPDRGELGPTGLRVDPVADRVLHPRVRRQDEVGADHGAERGQPDGGQVDALGQPVPAEDPQAEEGRLQEERDQRLHRQRRAENVPDKA